MKSLSYAAAGVDTARADRAKADIIRRMKATYRPGVIDLPWGFGGLYGLKREFGLSSRAYPGGRMCFRFEEPIHRFQNMVIDLMLGAPRIPPGDARETAPVFAESAS